MADIRSLFMKMGSKPKDKEKAGDDDAGGGDKKVRLRPPPSVNSPGEDACLHRGISRLCHPGVVSLKPEQDTTTNPVRRPPRAVHTCIETLRGPPSKHPPSSLGAPGSMARLREMLTTSYLSTSHPK